MKSPQEVAAIIRRLKELYPERGVFPGLWKGL